MLDTPVLLLVFNRPDSTFSVMSILKKIKPQFLYVAADGPRPGNQKDQIKCEEVKKVIFENIDWKCEVKTLFRENNLGCGLAVSSAISWFFEAVPEGIILEDDILPSLSFFSFCEELLIKYRNQSSVMMISGSNLLENLDNKNKESYFFSEYAGIWGWASWRRAWDGYDYRINSWSEENSKNFFKSKYSSGQYLFFKTVFDQVSNGGVDTWDYQWWYHRLMNKGVGVIPKLNLTQNIGFNAEATHTFTMHEEIKNATSQEIIFPLNHPEDIKIDKTYELKLAKKYFWKDRFIIQRWLKRLISFSKL